MAAAAAALAPSSVHSAKAEVNRRNAQSSTGPRTPEGKLASSQNAYKHGLFAALENLPAAERAIFDRIASVLPHAESSPDINLHVAARNLALHTYRQDRVRRIEFSMYDERVRELCQAEGIPEPTGIRERGVLEARIFREDALGPRALARIHAQEKFFTRQVEKATVAYLDALQNFEARRIASPPARPAYATQLPPAHATQLPPAPRTAPVASFSENAIADPEPIVVSVGFARSGPCPCGSGEKYKRCCGRTAPPQLHSAKG